MRKPKIIKPKRAKGPTKAQLIVQLTDRGKELEWAKKLIEQMQGEIRNVVALNTSLTASVQNLSKKLGGY